MLLTALTPVPPDMFTTQDRDAARAVVDLLRRLGSDGDVRVEAGRGHNERQTFVLSAAAARLLAEMLANLADGRTVTIIPTDASVTEYQAASLLNVSRPYVVQLLDEGAIPHSVVSTSRVIRAEDLLAYKRERDARSSAALDELARLDQELGLDT